ncbi:glycosyltransferase [Gordonibacter sp. 28C]|uniref:glycosyltransferase family 2 protein n=1 Tax=Gordonibacter sp. 28C TaxID=2078569 RepID=UPI0011C074F3|nr:glycosyltransferase family 2 protein [Gordonibacter sp. 28C]
MAKEERFALEIKNSNMCRGNGVAYYGLTVGESRPTRAFLSFENGRELSLTVSELGDFDDCRWGVSAPLLSAPHAISLECESDLVRKDIAPLSLKWFSRWNYRTNGDFCERLRQMDGQEGADFGSVVVVVNESLVEGDNLLVRGSLVTVSESEPQMAARLLDHRGNDLLCEVVIEHPRKSSVDGYPSISRWRAGFSVRVPLSSCDSILCAQDTSREDIGGFFVFDEEYLSHAVSCYQALICSAYDDPRYEEWLFKHRASLSALDIQRGVSFDSEPKISIIVPLYKTPLDFFRQMVESVLSQTYSNYELVLVNASPEEKELFSEIDRVRQSDTRILVVALESNRGIAENTLAGIDASSGDFIAFLDHDDFLEPNALFEYVSAVNARPDTDLLYCDEDKYEDGKFVNPCFKPDYNLDMLRSYNYICHFLMVRRSILDQCEKTSALYDGAQDYDIVLKVCERARYVNHVSKVLYHWRISAHSTAGGVQEKPYADAAGLRALEDHLERQSISALVKTTENAGIYSIAYDLRERPLVTIVIPNKDQIDLLNACIRSIEERSAYDHYEILIIENNSADQNTFAYYDSLQGEHDKVRVETWDGEFNFSNIVNFGVSQARGDYYLLLNNDTEVLTDDFLENMLGLCMRSDVGAVGACLYFPDGSIQHAGMGVYGIGAQHINRNLPRGSVGCFRSVETTQDFSAVTGACMMTKRSVFKELGGFDSSFAVAYNDVDYCLRAREKGYLVVYAAQAKLVHYESVSRGFDLDDPEKSRRLMREEARFRDRWSEYYQYGDPYVNDNLDQFSCHYRLP